jgi:Cys-rich protein (TIGR01571 family)
VATVPPGGVAKGEVFLTAMGDALGDDAGSGAGANQRTRIFRDMDAPPSRWRDELFDCFRHGLFHDFLWNSVCCPLIAISQIMARIQLSDTGDPVITIKSRTRVGWYVFLVLLLIAIHAACACFLILTKPDEETILMAAIPLAGLDVILVLYFLYMVVQTRKNVRREYGIPELRCHGHEDCCLAVFCTCCTIAQMGRHTADYETYQSHCCTDTGLANHVEVKLPCESLVDMEQGMTNDPREYSTYRLI